MAKVKEEAEKKIAKVKEDAEKELSVLRQRDREIQLPLKRLFKEK